MVLDGVSALLFHVEHASTSNAWRYRVRWPQSSAAELREWQRTREVTGEAAFAPLLDQVAAMEAEWQWAGDTEWQSAVPHVFEDAEAEFAVEILRPRDFRTDPVILAIAAVRGFPACFEITMPRQAMEVGRIVAVPGRSIQRGLGSVLRDPGDFASENEAFRIINIAPGKDALRRIHGPALPGTNPSRGSFFVRAGRLTPEEINQLLQNSEACQKS